MIVFSQLTSSVVDVSHSPPPELSTIQHSSHRIDASVRRLISTFNVTKSNIGKGLTVASNCKNQNVLIIIII